MIPFEIVQLYIGEPPASSNMIDLNDYTTCVVTSYAPVARRRRSDPLGERGVYNDERESMTLRLMGDTQANVMGRLEKLNRMLDYASLWTTNNSSLYRPMLLKIKPADGYYTSAYDLYIYVPTGFQPLTAKAEYDSDINQWVIDNVKVEFYSRSLYLQAQLTTSTVTVSNGRIATCNAPAWVANFGMNLINNTASPMLVDNLISGRIDIPPSLYAIGDSSYITLSDGAVLAGTTDWTSVADAARFPTNAGNLVGRITPTAANTWRPSAVDVGGWGLGTQLVWWKVRSSSTTAIWKIRLGYTVGTNTVYSDIVTFTAATLFPTIIQFNPTSVPSGAINFTVEVQCNVTGQTLDFDAGLQVTDIDRPDLARVIQLSAWNQLASGGSQRFTFPYQFRLSEPIVHLNTSANSGLIGYTGDPYIELASGGLIDVCWFAVPGTNFWRVMNTALGAALDHAVTISGRPAHVLPV